MIDLEHANASSPNADTQTIIVNDHLHLESAQSTASTNYEEKQVFLRQGSRRTAERTSLSQQSTSLIRELIVSAGICWIGWKFPRYLRQRYGVTQRAIPYQLTKSGDVILDLNLSSPYVLPEDVLINSWTLITSCTWFPMAVILLCAIINRRRRFSYSQSFPSASPTLECHAAACALFVSIGLSEFFTQLIKAFVGRLRPNFYEMCGFDAETLQCTAGEERQAEARQSFPSGHSSLSFNGMVFLSFFFLGQVGLGRIMAQGADNPTAMAKEFTRNDVGSMLSRSSLARRQIAAFLSVVVPVSYACFVASSRIVDSWHHPSDVIAGILIGTATSTFAYHLFFPSVFADFAGIPFRACCEAL